MNTPLYRRTTSVNGRLREPQPPPPKKKSLSPGRHRGTLPIAHASSSATSPYLGMSSLERPKRPATGQMRRKTSPAPLQVPRASPDTTVVKGSPARAASTTAAAAAAVQTNASHGSSPPPKPKKCYTFGVMNKCGSIYEELARQLVATGRWRQVTVKQRSIVKTLYVVEDQKDLIDIDMHLLLGEKMPMERLIETRRAACARHRAFVKRSTEGSLLSARLYPSRGAPFRVPMGTGADGEVRMIDFIDGTRCVTLKSTMLSTLLQYHHHDWDTLGVYLPMSFLLAPGQPSKDERSALIDACNQKMGWTGGRPPLWIAKSSSGSHGDNIQIFSGDRAGITRLLHFIDNQKSKTWVAQQYIDRPLLYHRRKFDIRCFALLFRDPYEIYVHEELIMRTSSVVYDRETATAKGGAGRLAHITNHCVQSEGADYSLYEEGNELWREHLDGLVRYKGQRLQHEHQPIVGPKRTVVASRPASEARAGSGSPSPSRHVTAAGTSPVRDASYQSSNGGAFRSPERAAPPTHETTLNNTIMPQIHHVVRDTLLAAREHLPTEPHPIATICFQVFGYDFLIDENLKVWLLEINGAPAGAARLLPRLMGDTIEKAIAPHFPGTVLHNTGAPRPTNGYVLVYPQAGLRK